MNNEYYRAYMIKRYHARMSEAKEKLGGKCVECGNKEKLEFDHINRKEKSFTIGVFWSCRKERFLSEVKKCQLLCRDCHEKKTLLDLGRVSAKNTHGTLSSYRYCRCSECRAAKAKHTKEARQKLKHS